MEGSETNTYKVSVPAADSAYRLANAVAAAEQLGIIYLDFVQADAGVEGRAVTVGRVALPATIAAELLDLLSQLQTGAS